MKFGWMAAFGLAVALVLTGCATTIGRDYDQNKVAQFVAHQTTLDQVIAALGQPQERETESDGSIRLHYQFIVSKGSVSDYVPFAPKSANTDSKDSYLYFDKSGRYLRAENNQAAM
jgi:outer membrane protein assembly factor BamE (lipoprotein component of BamABCDE complex)